MVRKNKSKDDTDNTWVADDTDETSTEYTTEEIPPVTSDETKPEVTDQQQQQQQQPQPVEDQPPHIQEQTKFRHQQALAAGFANAEQHETFLKQKQVAAQQGMPEPVGPTAPYAGAEQTGISEEQKKAIAKQAQQKQATQGNEK
jgi:hypothetical protein